MIVLKIQFIGAYDKSCMIPIEWLQYHNINIDIALVIYGLYQQHGLLEHNSTLVIRLVSFFIIYVLIHIYIW